MGELPKLNWQKIHPPRRSLPIDPQKPFYEWGLYFLHFHPRMQPLTLHLLFLLISIIFLNKCAKINFCLFNALTIVFANFLNHKQPNEHPLGCPTHHLVWNTCPIIHGICIFLHGIFTRVVTKPSPLGEHHPQCSMTPIMNKTAENKTYCPWSFITQLVAVFIVKYLLKIKTSW